ncbi:MAG: DNA recombination protein RmuC, partial [Christensenellales bacterium]
ENGLKLMDDRVAKLTLHTEQQLEQMRQSMEQRIRSMQEDNGKKLEQMRATVDEKLQKTLEDRIGQSFRLVNDRLEQVYKGLGEMQTLASGVGDLKKVLSNVKTRGIVGEIQLGSILDQILTPDQYDANVVTKHGSAERVEFAVKFPGDEEGGFVYLPIDAKFPADAYAQLQDAYDMGDAAAISDAGKNLDRTIRSFAKDISTKYIDPPYTTILLLRFCRLKACTQSGAPGLVETLQRDYHINIAGPP